MATVVCYTKLMNYLCIDFGGTKTLLSIIDKTGTVTTEVRIETPEHYPDFIDQLSDQISQLPEKFHTGAMAVPGLIDHQTGNVIALGNRPWTNFPLRQDLLERTGISFKLMNDARCGGLGEAARLIGQYRRVLYITISTGIGGALIVDGKLVDALNDTEFGKMPIINNASFTPWEELVSGRAIVATYGKRASDIDDDETWKEIAHNLNIGIGPACTAFQPDVIVLGGGVGKQCDRFSDFILDELRTILHPVVRQPQAILPAYYQDESVIYGCYELAKDFAS